MSEPVRLTADHVVYSFSPNRPSAIEVESGTVLAVETRDAYDRFFRQDLDANRYVSERRSHPTNPATGPIYVRGVCPGDGLDVTIEKIELDPVGYVVAIPGIGVLGDRDHSSRCVL